MRRYFLTLVTSHLCAVALSAASPSDYQKLLKAADAHFSAGRWTNAIESIQSALAADTNRFEGPAMAAMIFYRAGRTNEAQKSLELARRLVPPAKAKALDPVAKMLAEPLPQPANAAAQANSAPTSGTDIASLSPAARRQMNVLKLIIEEADQAKLDVERKRLLDEFLTKSDPFVRENKDLLNMWMLRAVAALELNRRAPGREAAQELERLGASQSTDAKLAKVLAQLDRKGWTGDEAPIPTRDAPFVNSLGMKFVPVPGTEVLFCIWETRVQDFEAFTRATGHDATGNMLSLSGGKWGNNGATWKSPGFAQTQEKETVPLLTSSGCRSACSAQLLKRYENVADQNRGGIGGLSLHLPGGRRADAFGRSRQGEAHGVTGLPGRVLRGGGDHLLHDVESLPSAASDTRPGGAFGCGVAGQDD